MVSLVDCIFIHDTLLQRTLINLSYPAPLEPPPNAPLPPSAPALVPAESEADITATPEFKTATLGCVAV